MHRRMVREALRKAEPAMPKKQQRRLRKLDVVCKFIDEVLEAERTAPPKQHHTARRIFDRLRAEVPGFRGSERSVRGYVQRRRQQLGLEHREVFVSQTYEWGSEAQVDWYEAIALVSGDRVKLQAFEMRSMASGATYHRVYTNATQQAFLEAHQRESSETRREREQNEQVERAAGYVKGDRLHSPRAFVQNGISSRGLIYVGRLAERQIPSGLRRGCRKTASTWLRRAGSRMTSTPNTRLLS